ncbi:hypothetical protein HELRODRAFT_89387 [Helobdella robusta]|uniref:Major facilitator superfamily (MFS) profile domain-containing protein n=1 Tax=Helobdella robusta TaxID=6412 RepID=T1G7C6_HELRO|nr:hypothetical protein HELRODRAFT_89387 [Helobdella robusta]ESN92534.1 hypothetical protein HELRODRAFT_89387 [Helobdella robusta]
MEESDNETELLVPLERSSKCCSVPRDVIASVIACIGSFIMGIALGYSSPALASETFSDFLGTKDNQFWFGSLLAVGAIFGGPIGGVLRSLVGLKFTLMLCNLPLGIGWLLILGKFSVATAFIGRVLTGVGIGVASFASPLYVSEVADKSRRGVLGLFFQLTVSIGILVSFALGTVLSWNYLALVFMIISVVNCLMILIIPESPRWYLTQHLDQDALESLKWLYRSEQRATIEINFLRNTLINSIENRNDGAVSRFSLADLKSREIHRPILIGIGLMVFQQLSGINAIMFYTSSIFSKAGFQDNPSLPTIITGSVLVAATFLSCFCIDCLGRRVLLLISGVFMTASMVCFGLYYYLTEEVSRTDLSWLSLSSVCAFIISFSFGWSSIPWLACSEIMPAKAKNFGISVTTISNWLFTFLITKEVVDLTYLLHSYGTMWLFAVFCAISVLFVAVCLPETKGKSLEEIQSHFTRGSAAR